jgi:hypothetical protein
MSEVLIEGDPIFSFALIKFLQFYGIRCVASRYDKNKKFMCFKEYRYFEINPYIYIGDSNERE